MNGFTACARHGGDDSVYICEFCEQYTGEDDE